MTDDGVNDAILREKLGDVVRHLKNGVYLSCVADSAYGQAIIWASKRIAELESQTQSPETGSDETRESFLNLGFLCNETYSTNESIEWGQNRIKQLELENENLSKTILTLSKSSLRTSSDSDEEIHQQRRRERMLDEVTLICVRDGIERLPRNETEEKNLGYLARDIAEKICWGIDKFDAT